MPDFPDPDHRVIEKLDEIEESTAECIVDLRRTVQVLADTIHQLRVDHIRLINACASIAPDRGKFFASTMGDDDSSELPLP